MALLDSQAVYPASHLRYCILRESDKSVVPLVPADQLPFQLHGVPRRLDHRQLADGWKLIEETSDPAPLFALSTIHHGLQPSCSGNTSAASGHNSKDQTTRGWEHLMVNSSSHDVCCPSFSPGFPVIENTLSATHQATVDTSGPPPISINRRQRPNEQCGATTHSVTDVLFTGSHDAHNRSSCSLPPSGIIPDPSKKVYCTYWIKTGECAFMDRGCMYKHEMPDLDKLRALGFARGYPRWWKEKQAIANKSSTWMERRRNAEAKGHRGHSKTQAAPVCLIRQKLFQRRPLGRTGCGNGRGLLMGEVDPASGALSDEGRLESAAHPAPKLPRTYTNDVAGVLIDVDVPVPPVSSQLSLHSNTDSEACCKKAPTLSPMSTALRTPPILPSAIPVASPVIT